MHKTIAEARAFATEFLGLPFARDVEIVVAPPFTALAALGEALAGSHVALGAQTMHESDHGPFTGEISAAMLREVGVTFVILGHSERRAMCGETDSGVNRKVRAALAHGITPIVAVGETAVEQAAGETLARVLSQTRAAFESVPAAEVAHCVVAYEPIWAIGTGQNEEPESANAVLGAIRASVEGLETARLLYGGSMKGANAAALMAQPHIDGGLIGGASLTATSFLEIVDAARDRARGAHVSR